MENKRITNVLALTYVLENCSLPEEYQEKIKSMRETFERKNSTKGGLTAKQQANNLIKKNIYEKMESQKRYTATDIANSFELESNQKASALLRQMVEEKMVERVGEKRKTYFVKIEG